MVHLYKVNLQIKEKKQNYYNKNLFQCILGTILILWLESCKKFSHEFYKLIKD